jgi:hypothetical protein
MAEPWWSWSDPQAWEANECGEVTPAQREVIVGPPVRQPWPAWALPAFLVIVEGVAGVLGATPKHGLVPGGGPGGVVATMVFIMVVVGRSGEWTWSGGPSGLLGFTATTPLLSITRFAPGVRQA